MKPARTSPVVDKGKDYAGTARTSAASPSSTGRAIANAADGRDIGAVELQAAAPDVASVSPGRGNPGDTVTITGTDLGGATTVKFGSTDATDFDIVSDTEITATVPAGSGTVDLTVTNATGTSATSGSDSFHYIAPPTVSGLSPDHGNAGDTVTITGTNFTGATGVKFGTADATDVTVNSATEITAKAPAGSGTIDVSVTTPDGTSSDTASDHFRYLAAPAISSLSPSHGNPGRTIDIDGTDFTGATAVKFGTTDATFSVVNDTQITATVPAGSGTVGRPRHDPQGHERHRLRRRVHLLDADRGRHALRRRQRSTTAPLPTTTARCAAPSRRRTRTPAARSPSPPT